MAYTIKRTDGTTIAVIADGSANTSTDLTLIGKNYLNYGTALNENLIRLLESFSNTSAPTKPVKGQLWYDSANSDLKIYNGTGWDYTVTKANALTVYGTIDAGNLNATGTLNVTGNANVGNIGATFANITSNLAAGNLRTTGDLIADTIYANANANVGNLTSRGLIVATGNITGGNIETANTVTASRLISNIATGTAPLTITSTTQVANLNVAVAGSLVNGNSNVVVDANSHVRISANGKSNVMVVAASGNVGISNSAPTHTLSVTGTFSVSGNANIGNLTVTNINATTFNSSVLQNGNSNITIDANNSIRVTSAGVANVLVIANTGITVNGVSNLTAISNVRITGGSSGQFITTDGAGNLSFTTPSVSSSIANGNSNVVVSANSNVTVAVTGATRATFTSTGIVSVGNITPSASSTYSLGNTSNRWSNIWGVSSSAQYADLAEKYHSDESYPPGTVVSLGGENEITKSAKDLDDNVFGVVSTNPAYLMNDNEHQGNLWLPIVLTGRANVIVTGTVSKGSWLVSAGDGTARAAGPGEIQFNLVIGRSLMNKTVNVPAPVEAYISVK